MLSDFMNVNVETTLSIAIIGTIFAGEVQITYYYFFLPIILSVIYMLPCLPLYFKGDEMTIRQIIYLRVFEVIILEAATLFVAKLLIGHILSTAGYIVVAFSVIFYEVLTNVIQWYLEKEAADKLNRKIIEYRNKKANLNKQ